VGLVVCELQNSERRPTFSLTSRDDASKGNSEG
jgi:hypothetical protein